MSLQIEQIVLHQLVKGDGQELNLLLREQPLSIEPPVQQMMEEINRVYNMKNRAFALFDEQSQLAAELSRYLHNNQSFITFSKLAAEQLRSELAKYPFAEGGVVVLCHYRYLAVEYLLVSLLNSCNSMHVSETLELSCTRYLDIDHADIIARVDLTEWQRNPGSNRYITFLKGRVGRRVADFFLDFLGASEGLNSKALNRELLQAVTDYCEQQPAAESERQTWQQQVYNYCDTQLKAGEEIEMRAVAQVLPAVGAENFEQFSTAQGYQLEESFPADRPTLRKLTKFVGNGGGISINFDALLLGERVFWDEVTDTLTIKGTPPNLREQLYNQLQRRLSEPQGED